MNNFLIGIEKYKSRDFISAIQYFELDLQRNPSNVYSIYNLIISYIRINDFKRARKVYLDNYELIENDKNNDYYEIITLELAEYNYINALNLLYKALNNKPDLFVLRDLARVNMELGNFEITRKIYETLMISDNERIKLQSIMYLVNFYMQMGDYEKARYYINSLDLDTYVKYYPKRKYNYTKNNLDALAGKVYSTYYVSNILKTHDEQELLDHINKHCNQEGRNTIGCFAKDINITGLLKEVREVIPTMNGSYDSDSIIYRYHFDNLVGYKGEEETNDLCIIKHCSGQIISMYPCYLSSDFNKEGWLTSEKLRLKRERGIKNEK